MREKATLARNLANELLPDRFHFSVAPFASQQLRKIFRSRHGFNFDKYYDLRIIIPGVFIRAPIGQAFMRSAGKGTRISLPASPDNQAS